MTAPAVKTILIVEDEALIALRQKVSLEKAGYRVLTSGTGEEAVDTVRLNPDVDLILMDIDLGGGMDGTEAAEIILRNHEIPVVFLSSHSEPEIVEKTEKITSYGYVVKNSSVTVLYASIKMAFKLFDANQKQKKSEARYQNIFENSPISIWEEDFSAVKARFDLVREDAQNLWREYFDAHEEEVIQLASLVKVIDINKAGVSFFNAKQKSDLFVSIMTYFSPDSLITFKEELIALAEGKTRFETEISIPGADHTKKELLLCLSVAPGYEQTLSCVILSFIDITDRKLAEIQLQKNNEELLIKEAELTRQNSIFTALLKNLPIGIFMIECPTGRPLLANDKAREILGRGILAQTTDNNIGEVYKAFRLGTQAPYPPEEMPIIKAMRGITSRVDDMTVERPDGSRTLLEVFGSPVTDNDGKIWASLVSFLEITERAEMENALRLKNEEVNRYFDSALDLLCIADTEGHFIRLNPEWEKVLGYTVENLEGRLFLDLVHPEDQEATLDALSRLREQKEVLSFENRYRCNDGSYRWIEWRSSPRGTHIYAAAHDITDRKKAEEKVARLLEEKELILKEVHHRIKNNMATIDSLLSLQAGTMTDPLAVEALEDAGNRVKSMAVLYDLLYRSPDFTELSIAEYLPSLIEKIIDHFPTAASVMTENHIDDFILDAKRLQTVGIIVNELLTNIMKHAFAGKDGGVIRVSASLRESLVTLTIADNGMGIADGDGPNPGGGFGLELVKGLTKQLKGKIRFERNGGTTVILEFKR